MNYKDKLNAIFSQNKDIETVLKYLRRKGCSKAESVKALYQWRGMNLTEAKKLVHSSHTWADRKDSDDEFVDSIVEVLESNGGEAAAGIEKDLKPCAGLVGKRLYEVSFVMDYVQLRFDGDDKFLTINAFAPIRITKADKEYKVGDDGHKDALCSLITKNVKSVVFDEEKGLEFLMESGETVRILEADRLKSSSEWVNYIDDKDPRNDLFY